MRNALILLPVVALAVAGFGASAAGKPASAHVTAAAAAKRTVVKTRHGSLGTFLVDGRGRTLYRFLKDTSKKSHCSGQCATFWPPLLTSGKPAAQGGAKASMLSTTRRSNGARQVTYNGRPLYHFSGDSKAGDTNGEGLNAFGARWYVVSTAGNVIKSSTAAAPPSNNGY